LQVAVGVVRVLPQGVEQVPVEQVATVQALVVKVLVAVQVRSLHCQ
jgi:hypothetical protein